MILASVLIAGAYEKLAPGLWFDLKSNASYPFPGPALYKSQRTAKLEPKELVILSPTGLGAEADATYYAAQNRSLEFQVRITTQLDAIGG